METGPAPWISALRQSQDRLRALTEPLTVEQLQQRSYAADWSIAQVLSHLGVPGGGLRPVPRRRPERAGPAGP